MRHREPLVHHDVDLLTGAGMTSVWYVCGDPIASMKMLTTIMVIDAR